MRRTGFVLLLVGLLGLSIGVWADQLTVWQLADDAFPGDMSWQDDGLYLGVSTPDGMARFNPTTGALDVWETYRAVGDFVFAAPRIFFALPYEHQLGWFRPDVGFLSFLDMPNPTAWPAFVLDGRDRPEDVNIWYLDWNSGHVGLFSPIESGPADLRDIPVITFWPWERSADVTPESTDIVPTHYPRGADFAPDTFVLEPIVNDPFTEWPLLSPDDPAYGFTRDAFGRIWISAGQDKPLYALNPANNEVTTYELPGLPFIAALATAADDGLAYEGSDRHVWFLAKPDEMSVELGLLDISTGDVTTWAVPLAVGATALRVLDDEIWFCDDHWSAIYRFTPETATFTWWATGGDDAPRDLELGANGEMWITFDRSGGIARLVVDD